MRVFIADDSAVFRSMLAKSIREGTGVDVVGHTDNSREAIHAIRSLQPDIIVVNLELRMGTAFGVLQEIRKERNTHPITIMLTNHHYNQYQKNQLSHGAEYFFHKASEFDKIVSAIKDLKASEEYKTDAEAMSIRREALYN